MLLLLHFKCFILVISWDCVCVIHYFFSDFFFIVDNYTYCRHLIILVIFDILYDLNLDHCSAHE